MKFRPRFSLRALAILVTLVCTYFAAWEATKRWGVGVLPSPGGVGGCIRHSPFPLLIAEDELLNCGVDQWGGPRRFYLWLFGREVKLPFESEWLARWGDA
jgi:hypothetical protein